MKTSSEIDKLSQAFIAAQTELKNAKFDRTNPHFKSKYATLPGMRDDVVPVLAKHGLGVIQGADMDCVVTRLVHSSGQWMESRYPFALDKPQQMGSAMTYARRYSLAAICGIASEEDDDGNAAQEGEKPAGRKPLATVTGEAAAPKAKSRDPFERIQAGIYKIEADGNHEDLTAWYKNNLKEIESWDAGWHQQIMAKFSEARETLNERFGPQQLPNKHKEAAE